MAKRKAASHPPAAGEFLRWFRDHPRIAFLFLSGAWVLLLYGRSLRNPFSTYDDFDQIVANRDLATWQRLTRR